MAPSGKRYESQREEGKSRQHVRPATGLAAHRARATAMTGCSRNHFTGGETEGTEFHSEHLSFKSWKGQDEVRRGGRQLTPTIPVRDQGAEPGVPTSQEVCTIPRGDENSGLLRVETRTQTQIPRASALGPRSSSLLHPLPHGNLIHAP